MSSITGYYYLHANGSLIWKRYLDDEQVADFRESPFVRHFWPLDPKDRENAWSLLVEASALDADPARVKELAELWACTDEDAINYADRIGLKLTRQESAWCASPTRSQNGSVSVGFGDSCLAAMADLCKQLGFRAQKTWGHTFKSKVTRA